MRRLSKMNNSKGGFSLTEMIIVVGIIVIIASVVGFGAADMIRRANQADENVAGQSDELKTSINDSESILAKYNF